MLGGFKLSHNIELKTSKMFLKAAVLFLVILAQLMFAEGNSSHWKIIADNYFSGAGPPKLGFLGGVAVGAPKPYTKSYKPQPPQTKSGGVAGGPVYLHSGRKRRSAEPEPQWWPQARGYGSYGSFGGFSRGGFGSYGGYGGWQQQGRK